MWTEKAGLSGVTDSSGVGVKERDVKEDSRSLASAAGKMGVPIHFVGEDGRRSYFMEGKVSFGHVRFAIPCLRCRIVVGYVGVCSPGREALSTWVAQKTVRMDKTLKGKQVVRRRESKIEL